MLKARRGFTLIEISLFLAITAVIFAGIVAGTQTSIYWQRYNDSVQSFAEFLRAEYSRVANVQNPTGNGDSNLIVYGRLVTFGNDPNDLVKSYSVIGSDLSNQAWDNNLRDQLFNVDINPDGANGLIESYAPKWGSRIQLESGSLFKGAILIIRHPETGNTYTYTAQSSSIYPLHGAIKDETIFKNNVDLNLCINPDGDTSSGSRRKVTITANAHNASGVVVDGECEWSPTS